MKFLRTHMSESVFILLSHFIACHTGFRKPGSEVNIPQNFEGFTSIPFPSSIVFEMYDDILVPVPTFAWKVTVRPDVGLVRKCGIVAQQDFHHVLLVINSGPMSAYVALFQPNVATSVSLHFRAPLTWFSFLSWAALPT